MKIKERSDYNFLNPAIGGVAAIPNERTLKIQQVNPVRSPKLSFRHPA